MYEFFNAVGLAGCDQNAFMTMENVLEINPSVKFIASNNTKDDNKVELSLYLGENLGIRACGFEDRNGNFIRESYFPFFVFF